jgi:DNA-binding response OmpR family regulator
MNGAQGDSTRVLVVDDEAPIRLLCRVNLEAEGMEVTEAVDGPGGLESARTAPPDVILLDVMMPGLDGWQVAEALLADERTRAVPIVFLTARAEMRDRARGLEAGGIDYVTKPFNPIELAPLVRDVLERVARGEREALRSERLAELRELMGASKGRQRAVCARTIAASTTAAPASCTAPSDSFSHAHATIVATTGSSMAIIATRVAGRWRRALTSRMKGTIVPTTITNASRLQTGR